MFNVIIAKVVIDNIFLFKFFFASIQVDKIFNMMKDIFHSMIVKRIIQHVL